jgi:hypothetical protein
VLQRSAKCRSSSTILLDSAVQHKLFFFPEQWMPVAEAAGAVLVGPSQVLHSNRDSGEGGRGGHCKEGR